MRILERYIFKSVIALFLGCMLGFFFLYIIIDLFSHLDVILTHKVAITVLKNYYFSNVPIIFVNITPMACLLATLYTFARMNHDNEIIAMRAAGLSVFQITRTTLFFGIVISLFIFWVNDRYVPRALFTMEKTKEQMENGSPKTKNKEGEAINNLSMYGLKNRLFFINKFTPATSTMEGIVILEQDEKQNITKKIVADKGIYQEGVWKFYRTITYIFDENGQIAQDPQYTEEEIMVITETPREFLDQRQRTEYMTIEQIDIYIWKLAQSGATTVVRNLKVELYQRFTLPLTSFITILLGIPFALKIKKNAAGLSSLGISLLFTFVYFVLNAVGIALGKAGILPPLAAVSLSHAFIALLSAYLIMGLP
jgi:lipopolysaccharide export system permease protein